MMQPQAKNVFRADGGAAAPASAAPQTVRHNLIVENRSNLTATGIRQVVSYDEYSATVLTDLGTLVIGGKNLKVSELSCQSGELRVGAAGLIVYLAVTLIISQVDIMVKRQELGSLNTDLARQMEQNTELERLISSGGEDEYMERIARDRLGYAAPGERIFIDMSGK